MARCGSRALAGGNAAWFAAERRPKRASAATTTLDDVWYKPYDHEQGYEKHARAYLDLGGGAGRADQARTGDPLSQLRLESSRSIDRFKLFDLSLAR